jgi:porin
MMKTLAIAMRPPGVRVAGALLAMVAAELTPAAAPAQDARTSPATMQGQQGEPAHPPPAQAAPDFGSDTLTGDWDGVRTRLWEAGVDLTAGYKGELASNVEGGGPTSATEAGQFVFGATIDSEKRFGWLGGTFQASIAYRQGAPLGVGFLQEPQEVYGRGDIFRLTELWYEQKLDNDKVTFKIGRMPQGDFDSFPCYFMNLTFCGAAGGNIVGAYWLNWPIAQWAGWTRVQLGAFDLMAGAYETNPTDLDEVFAPGWFSGAKGVMGRSEVGWSPKFGPSQLQGRYQLGFWYDTGGGDDVLLGFDREPFALTGEQPLHRSRRYGYYLQGIQQITGTGASDPDTGWTTIRGLSVFFNFIQSDRDTSTLDHQVAVGFLYAAPFASRPRDHIGIAFGRTDYNHRAAENFTLEHPGIQPPRSEHISELYYSYSLLHWITIQPDIQHVIDPDGFSARKTAIVLGVKTVINF